MYAGVRLCVCVYGCVKVYVRVGVYVRVCMCVRVYAFESMCLCVCV